MPVERLATGVGALDRLLGGGLEIDNVTELFGEAGSGKTIVCVEAARRVALAGRWVVYIDTEGLSVDRLSAGTADRLPDLLRHLLIATPKSLEEQTRAVRTGCGLARNRKRPIGLIVLDSATFFYRLTLGADTEDEGRQALTEELGLLVATSLSELVPVLVTNQVWRNLRDGSLEPLGGSFLNHAAKTIVRLERLSGDRRRAVLLKHRSLAESSADFRITTGGTA
ncbi:MAG: DNA repair and recombination protein RadB [Thermoplasmata archaeon]|nr:DNA repair and recombination protein RadB [Thermoplasmata archaeon]